MGGGTIFRVIAAGVTSLAVCMLRNNGVFLIFFLFGFAILVTAVKKTKEYAGMGMAFLGSILVYMLYSSILLPYLGILSDAAQESFSLPYQQTARYLKTYPEDVSEEELEIINRVLDAEFIVENYNPLLSDPVKGTYHGMQKDLKEYFKVWFRMFFRHPAVYIEATLHNSYGFFYPDMGVEEALGNYTELWNMHEVQYEKPEILQPYMKQLLYYWKFWERCPVVYSLYNGGIHTWIALWLIIYAIGNKNRRLFLLSIPSIVTILVCIASPGWWNNGFRYMLPVMTCNPFLLSVATLQKKA